MPKKQSQKENIKSNHKRLEGRCLLERQRFYTRIRRDDFGTDPYLSVQALTKYVKRKFDADPHLRNVYVKGNYRMSKTIQRAYLLYVER